jgi:hypothetical protein
MSKDLPAHQTWPLRGRVLRADHAALAVQESRDPRGTIVETHLASRSLKLPSKIAGAVLRFNHPCPWKDEATGQVLRVPAMITTMRSIVTDEVVAIHRTRLTSEGRKVDRRMLAPSGRAAIPRELSRAKHVWSSGFASQLIRQKGLPLHFV